MSRTIGMKDLRKVFKSDDSEVVAVEDFTLSVKQGELISILGPSGSGKTTILRMIAGLNAPTSGDISVGDTVYAEPGPDCGMVFQDFALFPWRSVRKNAEFGLEIRKMAKEERKEKADTALELACLTKFASARVHELSGGMKQRVGIARADHESRSASDGRTLRRTGCTDPQHYADGSAGHP